MDEYFAYLFLEINRDTIIEDTLNSLTRSDINFRKPLRIKFIGELGVDEGGVQKEFF
jgi:ubiquitin-protein ligase E3 A